MVARRIWRPKYKIWYRVPSRDPRETTWFQWQGRVPRALEAAKRAVEELYAISHVRVGMSRVELRANQVVIYAVGSDPGPPDTGPRNFGNPC